ncbi:putative HTH-type transcriptional regulator YwbI [Anaeromyxobacter oryzae]|uniref:HTH-type transcriptional regulator YwbI n=2 Tax=Anaeromyxobacter oryzae TaxID=2918170 RepID=A0ABN6MZ19_9BACT|nr:putative HTH-type transcriptional regulator YwbI [Anaeromyxobacter oryzae]
MEVFVEVVRQRGFTRAGAVLHLSQSAVSKAVRALEDSVGVPLLLREGRGVEPTAAGRVVFERSEAVLRSVREIDDEVADLSALRRGRVRVGLPPMVGAAFFPAVLGAFRERHAGVSLELREQGAREIEAAIAGRDLDVGVTVLPTNEEVFEAFPFVRDELAAVLHRTHPLAGRKRVRLAELAETPLVLYSRDFALHAHILDACRSRGFSPKIASESSQWDFIAAMVAANVGMALLPRTICRRLEPGSVRVVTLVDPTIGWNLALIRRRGGYASEAARAFVECTRGLLAPGRAGSDPG